MTKADHFVGQAERGDHIVRGPRCTDAIGHSLRDIFATVPMPSELDALLARLDRITHH